MSQILFTISFCPFALGMWGANIFEILPQNNLEELLVWGTIFIILFVIGIYLILNIRKSIKNDNRITNDELLLRFSKLYDEGKLTKEEYRQIKLQFAQKLKEERLGSYANQGTAAPFPSHKKGRKKKKKKRSESQDTAALLQSLLESSSSFALRSGTAKDGSGPRSDEVSLNSQQAPPVEESQTNELEAESALPPSGEPNPEEQPLTGELQSSPPLTNRTEQKNSYRSKGGG